MKNAAILFLFGFLFLSSCEKVIQLDLKNSEQQVVIEAFVTEGESEHLVKITKTLGLDQDEEMPTVDGALVVLSDNTGNSQTLLGLGNGVYKATAFPAYSGRTYTLSVSVEGKNFTASSTIPGQVPLDSLTLSTYVFGDTINTVTPSFLDPAGIANYYKFRVLVNDTLIPSIFLQDDQFIDGNRNEQPLFSTSFSTNDTVTVELLGIDKAVYKYFYALEQNESATPANPVSNFSGGCLGYFMARTRSIKSVVVP